MGNCISVCGSKDATADTGASREDVQRHPGRTNDAPVQDGLTSRSNRNATAQRNAQLPPVTERELPVEGRTSRLVKRSDGTQSQYLLDGHDLFGTYSTASSKPARAREERVVGAGAQTRVHERNNPNAPVLVKIARSAGENEEHTRRLDRLALMLATTPDREMAAHFAIEVRKGADDGKAVTLTPKGGRGPASTITSVIPSLHRCCRSTASARCSTSSRRP